MAEDLLLVLLAAAVLVVLGGASVAAWRSGRRVVASIGLAAPCLVVGIVGLPASDAGGGAWLSWAAALVSLVTLPPLAYLYCRDSWAVGAASPPRNGAPTAHARHGVRSADDRLHLAQEHFKEIAETSRAGLWVQDASNFELIYVSPAFEAIWGRSAAELYDDARLRLEAVHGEDRARIGGALQRAAGGREFLEEYRVERPDGSTCWVWDRGVPIRDGDGRILHIAGFAEDITARKGVEEVNLFRANFVANMSHEVRTPLNIMIGYLEFLLDGTFGELSQQQREITERVRTNAEELLALMSASLDLSRLDNRTIPLEIEPIEFAPLLVDVANDSARLVDHGDVRVRAAVVSELPIIFSDRQKLKMVLKNLLSNAVKFTERGEVVVGARALGDGLELFVSDTGSGIAPDLLPRVFEPFRQGANASNGGGKGGVGLGLYIVRRLVDILEGRISLESTLGRGTTFRVWLPVRLTTEREFPAGDPEAQALAEMF